jgi:hypothetical protein
VTEPCRSAAEVFHLRFMASGVCHQTVPTFVQGPRACPDASFGVASVVFIPPAPALLVAPRSLVPRVEPGKAALRAGTVTSSPWH